MRIIRFYDKEFPKKLKIIKKPPKQIWTEGDISLLENNSIAIVGSRACTEYGEKWCKIFTKKLIEYDLTIVSGMAAGIDKIAHETTLKYQGRTIAVLPCGFNHIYPKENEYLYRNIVDNGGLVISEYPPEESKEKEKCLQRNRIVCGLSIGVLIVEAAYRSGTSVTAKFAKEQNKMVFCIPGSLENSKSVGTNNLIQKGAKSVSCIDDIINCYNYLDKKRDISKIEKEILIQKENIGQKHINIEKEDNEIYSLIIKKPREINEIAKTLKIPLSEALAKVTMLELEGKIEKRAGGIFYAVL